MKSIFEPDVQKELIDRLNRLTSQSASQWGKMNVAQMLAHCAKGFQVPVGDLTIRPTFLRHIGRFFKSMALNDKPFSKNSPTAAEFLITDQRDFETEKKNFIQAFYKFSQGEHAIVLDRHAFFGPMKPVEWGIFMFKHTDHHFRQFGV